MPSFEALSMVFLNSTGVKSFTEGLDRARPVLGAPVGTLPPSVIPFAERRRG